MRCVALLSLPTSIIGCARREARPSCIPEGVLRWIVPNAPGGSPDVYSRLLQPFLEEALGRTIKIDNIPGASGLIGVQTLARAKADGLTLGVANLPGLITANLLESFAPVDPLNDLKILCRIARSRHVWVTGARSGINDFGDLLKLAKERPIVFGLNSVGSVGFLDIAIASELLDLPVEYVTGYKGSRSSSLAPVRGEVDLAALTYESILDRIEEGELRPILQISDEPLSAGKEISKVSVLGGRLGVAVDRARELGKDPQEVLLDASALISLIGAGRVLAGPARLSREQAECLEEEILTVLSDSRFLSTLKTGRRSLDISSSRETLADLERYRARAERFKPMILKAFHQLRA